MAFEVIDLTFSSRSVDFLRRDNSSGKALGEYSLTSYWTNSNSPHYTAGLSYLPFMLFQKTSLKAWLL